MGQCMVVRAVFSPGRGDVYDVSQVGSITKDGSTDVGGIGSGVDPTTGVAPQTVFEYLTPKSLIYLIHRGRSLLRRFRIFEEEECQPDDGDLHSQASFGHTPSSIGASPALSAQQSRSASISSPPTLLGAGDMNMGFSSEASSAATATEKPLSHYRSLFQSTSAPSSSFIPSSSASSSHSASGISSPSSLTSAAASPFVPNSADSSDQMFSASSGGMDLDPSTALSSSSSAHSLVQRLNQQSSDSLSVSSKGSRRSGLSGSSSISGTAFPSLAVARAANAFASEKPPKLQFYLQSMTQESIAELSKLYMIEANLIPILFSHFLKNSSSFSSSAKSYVLSEPGLMNMLKSQMRNPRLVNRLFLLFARGDAFGLQFTELLMMMYALSEQATTEDKTWVAFKVCDFSNRQALGVPELRQLLVSVLEFHGKRMAPEEMDVIIRFTIEVGDHNKSGALEYAEFRQMILQQPDFLHIFTIRLRSLLPTLDVISALVDEPSSSSLSSSSHEASSKRRPLPSYVASAYAAVAADKLSDSNSVSSSRPLSPTSFSSSISGISASSPNNASSSSSSMAARVDRKLANFVDDERVIPVVKRSTMASSEVVEPASASSSRSTSRPPSGESDVSNSETIISSSSEVSSCRNDSVSIGGASPPSMQWGSTEPSMPVNSELGGSCLMDQDGVEFSVSMSKNPFQPRFVHAPGCNDDSMNE